MRKQSFIIKACHMPGIVVGCHLLCLGSCLARGVVLQLFVQTYHRLLSAFWHFYNQCLFNSFRQVNWLECESKVSFTSHNHHATQAFTHIITPPIQHINIINPITYQVHNNPTLKLQTTQHHHYSADPKGKEDVRFSIYPMMTFLA